ncbi:MAG: hypothetical protein P9L94_04295, partial [Candidatus Hinthialibacter antarcticus]|nr:hypothetical protein [Candidatus Hinthialibacter antarcticus]
HKGLKARTEASRVVPMPDTAKDQEFTKKRQKNAIQFVIKYPNTGRTIILLNCDYNSEKQKAGCDARK